MDAESTNEALHGPSYLISSNTSRHQLSDAMLERMCSKIFVGHTESGSKGQGVTSSGRSNKGNVRSSSSSTRIET